MFLNVSCYLMLLKPQIKGFKVKLPETEKFPREEHFAKVPQEDTQH